MYYLGDFANFSEITDEDRARSRKYARRGALSTVPNIPKLAAMPGGLGAKIEGKKRRNRKAEYSQKVKYALFKNGEESVEKKRNWLRTGAKVATVGALGLGAGAAGVGGLIHLSKNELKKTGEANIKRKVKNAFNTLGIGETSNIKDIKSAYRKASKTAHPDMPTGNRDLFQKVNDAYEYVKPDGTGRMKDLSNLNKQQDIYRKARNFYLKTGGTLGGAGVVGVGRLALTRPKKEEKQTGF